MKNNFTHNLFVAVSLLLTLTSLSSCNRPRQRPPVPQPIIYNTVNIINTTHNTQIDGRQTTNIIVQNIDNSRREQINQIINNITNNNTYVTINNTSVNMQVDNSIHYNCISQSAIQQIYKYNRHDGNNYYFKAGDKVEINNINIGDVRIGGIIAVVDNTKTSNANVLILDYETYIAIQQCINNHDTSIRQIQCSSCGKIYPKGEKHYCKGDRKCEKCGATISKRGRPHQCFLCNSCGKYYTGKKCPNGCSINGGNSGDPLLWFFAIIGMIVVFAVFMAIFFD